MLYDINRANLVSPEVCVEAPIVKVTIGEFTFGVYEAPSKGTNKAGVVQSAVQQFPNYIQNLTVKKINGTVNTYTLELKYPITADSDPNFFERVLSSVSDTRKIHFEYGDAMMPGYIFKDEEAIITKVNTSFGSTLTPVISYTIEAVSTSSLSLAGSYTFPAPSKKVKCSDIIKGLIQTSKYNLKSVFTGMSQFDLDSIISSDDKAVELKTQANVSILEYLTYLVNSMSPAGQTNDNVLKNSVYTLTTLDSDYGPYFTVSKVQTNSAALKSICTYELDIGYPSSSIIKSFDISQSDNYSIYYKYNESLNESKYLRRIDSDGSVKYIYSPQLTGSGFAVTSGDRTW